MYILYTSWNQFNHHSVFKATLSLILLFLNRDEEDQNTDAEEPVDNVSVASAGSVASQATITPETVSSSSAPAGRQNVAPSPLKRSHTVSANNVAVTQVS